ncbi:bromodomain-containing protein [Biomphalaria pfeifferi]|uniref:Bromodomain-containing protein n=1 Tax=Biomphalaria pfeifferi TaxID=112525 RepID=A0AAD8EVW8_BIOPF|nr:bromodomain-containing protein [Biomphalaria pfeifferi]
MTFGMDCSTDDQSPPLSDHMGSNWLNWEHEIASISGLNIESSTELNGLVEDKEIAARAVAFVVNSTRKGIVPLCADIANLLRAKRCLEKKVYLLKREVEATRSSTSVSFRTSHSTSPTPPLIDKSLTADISCLQERSRPCSRCSQCSSNVSNSPKLECTYSFKNYLPSPALSREALRRASPRLPRQHHKLPLSLSQTHVCSLHASQDFHSGQEVQPGKQTTEPIRRGGRKNSLPEMTSEPSEEVKRINPKISKETQCNLPLRDETPMEEQFIETVRLNSRLAEELGSAKKEIEILKGRLKELEMNHLAKECTQNHFQRELDEKSFSDGPLHECGVVPKYIDSIPKHLHNNDSKPRTNGLSTSKIVPRVPPPAGSLHCAEPLYGCKCTACDEAMGGELHAALSASLNENLHKFAVNSKVIVQLGDHVVVKGEKTGRIRYIGHLDKIGQPNMVFVGLELDAPVGRHDGYFNKKRYFFCQKDHGIFLPLHDVICKVEPKLVNSADNVSGSAVSNNSMSAAVMSLRSFGNTNELSKSAEDFVHMVGVRSRTRQSFKAESDLKNLAMKSVEIDAKKCAEDLV